MTGWASTLIDDRRYSRPGVAVTVARSRPDGLPSVPGSASISEIAVPS